MCLRFQRASTHAGTLRTLGSPIRAPEYTSAPECTRRYAQVRASGANPRWKCLRPLPIWSLACTRYIVFPFLFFTLDDAPFSIRHLALIQLCPTSFCTDPYACSLTLPLTSSSCADQNLYETCPRACDMLTVSLQSADKTVSNSSAMLPPWYHTHTIPAPTIRWTTFLPFPSSCFYHPT